MIDIDYFKQYNDRLGHPAGDELLRRLSSLLSEDRRANDLVARYGGEEFAVVLVDTPRHAAMHIAEQLRGKVQDINVPDAGGQPGGHVSISVGVASCPDDASEVSGLVGRADAALYRAKAQGRNCVVAAA
jgi:diguanylate cyclase (GGDEF)-like protein